MDIQHGAERMSKTVVLAIVKTSPANWRTSSYDAELVRELGILAVTLDEKVLAVLPNLRRTSGVAVAAVPTEYAGLNPGLVAGDVIYSLNNRSIRSLDELREELKARKSGDPIVFLVERSGQLIYVTSTSNNSALASRLPGGESPSGLPGIPSLVKRVSGISLSRRPRR